MLFMKNYILKGSISQLSLIGLSSLTNLENIQCTLDQCFSRDQYKDEGHLKQLKFKQLKVKHVVCNGKVVKILSKLDDIVKKPIQASKFNLNDPQFENSLRFLELKF